MKHYPTLRKLWREIFYTFLAVTVVYIISSLLFNISGDLDIFVKYILIIGLSVSAFRYFLLFGQEGTDLLQTPEPQTKLVQDEILLPTDPSGFDESLDAPLNLPTSATASLMPAVEPIIKQENTNVEPIYIDKPVYIEREIIIERPVIIEKEIIVEKPVYREVEREILIEKKVEKIVEAEEPVSYSKETVQEKEKTEVKAEMKVEEREEIVAKESPKQDEKIRQKEIKKTGSESDKKYLPELQAGLRTVADPAKKQKQADFFQAEAGEYAEGDEFLGVKLSDVLKLSEQYQDLLDENEVKELLASKIHEERLTGIWVLIKRFESARGRKKGEIYDFYMKNRRLVNNWDLVDLAARNIVGPQLVYNNNEASVLESLAGSKTVWDKRTSIMATTSFVNKDILEPSFMVAEMLLKDKEDLVQSSVGWILKEVYKKDAGKVESFLQSNFKIMSNQAVRIASEKMEKKRRKEFLKGNFDTVHL